MSSMWWSLPPLNIHSNTATSEILAELHSPSLPTEHSLHRQAGSAPSCLATIPYYMHSSGLCR